MSLPLLLLVDDAPDVGEIVSYLGKRAGVEVVACLDVPTAWEFLQTRRPDLLLLDVNLPGIGGPELCRRIRSTPSLADLVIALFSHWGLPADVAAGYEAGADFVVSKELISRPVEWRLRLEEILGAKDSQLLPRGVLLLEGAVGVPIRANWPTALNQVLGAARRLIGSEVLRIVVRRAFTHAQTSTLSETDLAPLTTPDGFVNTGSLLSAALDAQALTVLIASLAEQMTRLLGAEASRPIREGLADVVPGLSGLPAN